MILKRWVEAGWLKSHRTDVQELSNLFMIVERDLKDARASLSPDWRFGIACNAALKLATILLFASGYRAVGPMHHARTIQAVSSILGRSHRNDILYLDTCRRKRNLVEYDCVGGATDQDADELIAFAESFRVHVVTWLKRKHRRLAESLFTQ